MGGADNCAPLQSCMDSLRSFWSGLCEVLQDIFIIIRKNLRIRRRRFMALILEMLTPIFIACIIASANNYKALLRVETLEFVTEKGQSIANDTLEGFYDLGTHFDESDLMENNLCSLPSDIGVNCRIGYVADPDTKKAVIDRLQSGTLKNVPFFNNATFIQFKDEQEIEDCLQADNECSVWRNKPDAKIAVLSFRGAIVFETGVNAQVVKYKIRLMEKSYNSLKHVFKTDKLFPSIYDRREYLSSYVTTGFLGLQLLIDRMIIDHMKTQSTVPDAAEIRFDSSNIKCTCEITLHEIPHRQTDQFGDAADPLDINSVDYIDEDTIPVNETENEVLGKEHFDFVRFQLVHKQSVVVSTVIVLSFTFLLLSEQRRISSEKENGLTILLLITGMTHRMQWVGNLFALILSYIPTITVVVILLKIPFDSHQGAVFEMTSGTVLWIILFLHVAALASAGYCTTVFFDKRVATSAASRLKAMTAISASLTIWVVTFVGPVYHIDYYYDIVPLWATFLVCLHPCIALQLALRLIIRYELHEVRTDLLTIGRFIPTDQLNLMVLIVVLICDTVLYMVLTIYLDRIFKSKYGVNKPWYYIFKSSEYMSSTRKTAPATPITDSTPHQPGFEPNFSNAEPSVITTDLTKKYGNVVALENLNIKLYHGEIFALLGHNGAGKSTTLNLFSGFTPATSGTATVYGYDIRTHMVQIQAFTGMCPQRCFLYDDLTPYEHLLIFGRLRGLRGDDAGEESMELLEKLRIHEMAHWTVRKLSKGDKRKLSLAVALIGNPKVLILDEPTGGLDYYSRRAVWDLLLKIRSNHTIIFTTHFMEEAELLGDKIGILSTGKMHVFGSHAFLRRHFGLGYSLKMKVNPNVRANPQEILRVVQGSMPKATQSTLLVSPNSNRVFTYNLPMDGYSSAAMSTLFIDLAGAKEQLGILSFSVANTTVDEIFLELARQLNPDAAKVIPLNNDEEEYIRETHEENIRRMFAVKRKLLLFMVQYCVLVRKRMLFTWRSKRLLVYQIILPYLVFVCGMARLSSHVDVQGRSGPPIQLSVDTYPRAITLYHTSEDNFIKEHTMRAAIGSGAKFTKNSDISGDYIHTEYETLRQQHFYGLSAESGTKGMVDLHVSPYVLHAGPIAVNIFSNLLVKHLNHSRRVVTFNHPLQHPYFKGPNYEEDPYAADFCSMIVVISGAVTVAFCVIFPVEERLNGMKHLQLMSGVHPAIYWLAIFSWDVFLVGIEGLFVFTFFIVHEPLRVIVFLGATQRIGYGRTIVFVAYIYCALMLTYAISHFARSKSGAFALLLSVALLFGVILPFLNTGLIYSEHERNATLVEMFLKVIPYYSLALAQRKYALSLLGNGRCNHLTTLGIEKYCSVEPIEVGVDSRKLTCCPNCVEIPSASHCFDLEAYTRLPWTHFGHFQDGESEEDFREHVDAVIHFGVFYEVIFLLSVGIFLNFVTVFLDSDAWRYLQTCVVGERSKAFQTNVEEEDVLDEMDRVERMVDKKRTDKEALVVHNLCKSYGTYPALHNLSFTVHPGESFGIIGVNGSGKSSLFNVLTGGSTNTYGNVYSVDSSLNTKRSILTRKMGYAPHKGTAVITFMTCLESIVFFGRIRGLTSKVARKFGNELLVKMGLDKCGDKHVGRISEGMKLRLGMAMAVIGDPPIVLFDEPTSSSDPTSRRHCWEILKEVKNAGHTLIFSSHTILECEELCQRMVILVDGKFQCIGSPSHLRKKFGSGYKLLVKLIPGPAESQGYVSSLSESIVNIFSPCTLRDRRRNVVQYVIHNEDFSWDFLFQMMEHTKLRYNDLVEDYAFSNTTMEEVFLSFVVLQNCGRILDQSTGCFSCHV